MTLESIGRYSLKGEIGRGGMAVVYRGYDPMFKRDVAIKIMGIDHHHDPTLKARFEREAQTIAALEHPAIVPVYDFGEEDGRLFLVMRLMAGGSLKERIAQGPMALDKAFKILQRIASALDRAHQKGVIHRDLKPGNIMFDEYGDAFLGDFGIARLTESTVTLTGDAIIGTPAYMSPEQIHGDKGIDARSDIYALGIICFELLTGKRPYDGATPSKVMMSHIMDPIPDIRSVQPDLPEHVDSVIKGSLAKEPDKRFATAGDLSETLRGVLYRPAQADAAIPVPTAPPTTDAAATQIAAAPEFEPTVAMAPDSVKLAPVVRQPAGRPAWLLPVAAGFAGLAFLVLVAWGLVTVIGRLGGERNGDDPIVDGQPTATIEATESIRDQPTRPAPTTAAEDGTAAAAALYDQFVDSYANGDLLAALRLIEEAIALQPDDGWYHHEKAHVLWSLSEIDAAFAANAAGVATGNALGALYSQQALFHRELGEPELALSLNEQAIAVEPGYAYAYQDLAMTQRDLGDYGAALAALAEALALEPSEDYFLGERAAILKEIGDYEAAISDLNAALELDPDELWHYDQLAEIYLDYLGEPADAVAWMEKSVALEPDSAWRYNFLALAYRELGDFDHALANHATAIELDSADPYLLAERADTYRYYIGDPEKALADLDQAIRQDPENADFYGWRGEILQFEFADFEGARIAYDKALELNGEQAWLFNNRAILYRDMGELALALADHEAALALDPHNAFFYLERGYTYLWLADNPLQALAEFNEGLAMNPDVAALYHARAVTFAGYLDNGEEALLEYDRCLRVDDSYPWCYFDRAWLYVDSGDIANAVADFRSFLDNAVPGECPLCISDAEEYIATHADD